MAYPSMFEAAGQAPHLPSGRTATRRCTQPYPSGRRSSRLGIRLASRYIDEEPGVLTHQGVVRRQVVVHGLPYRVGLVVDRCSSRRIHLSRVVDLHEGEARTMPLEIQHGLAAVVLG